MTNAPQFKYFLSRNKHPVQKFSKIWSTPLPRSRHQRKEPFRHKPASLFNYGDYFCSVRNFLKKDNFRTITLAASQYLHRQIQPDEIEKIRIYLEKHGEFYHPARIETVLLGLNISFVLNVAISNAGKHCIQREYMLLKKLNTDFPFSFIPKVYGQGLFSKRDNLEFDMFIGEWLEGFNEFHISKDPIDEKEKIVVWNPEKDNFFLKAEHTLELYRQTAMILTFYYNIETFEQIFPWHHAAGDFVVKLINNKVSVKLITVRQYASLFGENEIQDQTRNVEFILEAMLVFFLNLSIRMRLDRLDGTGEIVWSDDLTVEGTVKGCFDGLILNPSVDIFQEPFADLFRNHLSSCSQTDLFDLLQSLVNKYNSEAPEVPIIKLNLMSHVKILSEAVRKFLK